MAKGEKRQKSKLVTRWLDRYRQRRALLLALGSIGALLCAIPVLVVTWWVIWLIQFFVLLLFGTFSFSLTVTWCIFGLLFVAHVTSNREHLEDLRFDKESSGLLAAKFAAAVAGYGNLGLFLTGPDSARSQIKVISLILLIGPAMLGQSWRLARASVAAWQMDVATVGIGLTELLIAERRVLVDELIRKTETVYPPRFLREMLLVDGVILLTSGDPALTLTDGLRSEIVTGVEQLAESA